jgi:hypothetical protein
MEFVCLFVLWSKSSNVKLNVVLRVAFSCYKCFCDVMPSGVLR